MTSRAVKSVTISLPAEMLEELDQGSPPSYRGASGDAERSLLRDVAQL